MKFELSTEVGAKLYQLGFKFETDGTNEVFKYASGSISNWTRITITPAYDMCSLVYDEQDVPCVHVVVESESAPGYAETDWHHKKEGNVATANILRFLENEGLSLKPYSVRKEAMMQRYYERKNLRDKLEEAGFDYDEVKRILG